jgi:hypothetical protein
MNHRRKLIVLRLVLVLVIVFGLCALLIPSGPADPLYDGKPLSYWLTQWKTFRPEPGVIMSGPALDYKRLDTNAIPYLVYAFESRDGPARRKYRELYPWFPGWLKSSLPEPRDTATIRGVALEYLIRLETFDSPQVISAMARTLETDDDWLLKSLAVNMLEEGHSKDPAVIQALVRGLQDKDERIREECTNALRKLDPAALTNATRK